MAGPAPRISALDALRGIAVLGILVVNIQSFAFVRAARTNPTVQGTLQGADWWIWLVTYVLFDGKFISMFALLFGASIVLRLDRGTHGDRSVTRIHIRRMAILLVVGLLHAYLLWYGDWLATLAVCGAVAFLYRDVPPRRLVVAGVVVYAVASLIAVVMTWSLPSWSTDAGGDATAAWAPSADVIAAEVARYRSGWVEQMGHRIPAALRYQTSHLATRSLWQMTGLMLVGMALLRLGVLTAARPAALYASMAALGFGIGVPLVLYGVSRSMNDGWDVGTYRAVTSQCNYWGGLVMSLGWIGGVMLLLRLGVKARPLAAVGRLALTNYLLQSVICTTI